ETFIPTLRQRLEKDIYSIVRRASSRMRLIPDQARVTKASNVQPMLLMIPGTPPFACELAYPINSRRIHDSVLRRIDAGCRRTEDGDRTWPVNLGYLVFHSPFEHV